MLSTMVISNSIPALSVQVFPFSISSLIIIICSLLIIVILIGWMSLIISDVENFLGEGKHPTPVLLPGKSHGQRSLVGCSPWGSEELDRTERLHFHFSLSCIGERNGNQLQCSCLENPRDGEPGGQT